MVKRSLWIGRVRSLVDCLAVPRQNRFQLRTRLGRGKTPFAPGLLRSHAVRIKGQTLRRIVLWIEAQTNESHVFCKRLILRAHTMELTQDVSCVRASPAGGA